MFGYRSNVPKVRLTTDRLVVRLVHDRDAWRLADYYAENRHFLKPWEPVRDESHCYPSGWQARLGMINEFHKQGSAFYFGLFDPDEKEIIGVANEGQAEVAAAYPGIAMDKRQVRWFQQ